MTFSIKFSRLSTNLTNNQYYDVLSTIVVLYGITSKSVNSQTKNKTSWNLFQKRCLMVFEWHNLKCQKQQQKYDIKINIKDYFTVSIDDDTDSIGSGKISD